jgi:transposase
VAIDMSACYRPAIRQALPAATIVVDHFHVVQLAGKALCEVRRRPTFQHRGRRGRKSGPEWIARNRLTRNWEDLTDEQVTTMWTKARRGRADRHRHPHRLDRQGRTAHRAGLQPREVRPRQDPQAPLQLLPLVR